MASPNARQMVLRQQNITLGATPEDTKGTIHTGSPKLGEK